MRPRRFVIAGLGSAGQRHVRNLRRLCGPDTEIIAWRVRGLDVVIDDQLHATVGRRLDAAYGLKVVTRLEEGLAAKPDALIVANPIAFHLDAARSAVAAGCSVFIEKPLSHSWDGVEELIEMSRERRLVTYVGYQMRFHPGLQLVKRLLDEDRIGRVVSAQFHFGEYLPGMHPYEDYREGHAARKAQGGGAVLCLSHELDLAQWFFGMPRQVSAVGGRCSALELDVEDTATILLDCSQDGRPLPVSVHLDFVQRPPRRFCEIVGEQGTIRWDDCEHSVQRFDPAIGAWRIERLQPFDRNQMFLDELAHFLRCLEGTETPLIPAEEGAKALKIALAALAAIETTQGVAVAHG